MRDGNHIRVTVVIVSRPDAAGVRKLSYTELDKLAVIRIKLKF